MFYFSSRRRHTRLTCDWSSDVCSSDLAGGGCEAIFAPIEKSAGGAALGGCHARYMAMPPRDRHMGSTGPYHRSVAQELTDGGGFARIMSAHIPHDHRRLGFDRLEWLMLVVAV